MKKLSKVIALLLSGCMMLSAFVSSAVTVCAADDQLEAQTEAWDGGIDTSWYDSEEQELYIFSATEFAGLASLVNSGKTFEGQTVYLESDIDLSGAQWTPIGLEKNKAFCGILDGKGHVINNFVCTSQKQFYGLFGYLSGTVRYLSLSNLKCAVADKGSNNYESYGGAIAAIVKNGTIENCKASGTVSGAKASNAVDMVVGGIAGKVTGRCEMRNCHIEGNVSLGGSGGYYPNRNSYAGGICGLQCEGEAIIDCCSVLAAVFSHTGSYEQMAYAGGICGAAFGSLQITNTYNCGSIVADSKRKSNSGIISDTMQSCSGGIAGYISSQSKIENVYNTGSCEAVICGGAVGISADDATLKNVFYMSASAEKGVAKGDDTTIAKSTANMKKAEFANSLGDAFVYVEGSYPKLAWELDSTSANTDPAIAEMQIKVGESTQMTVTNYTGGVTWVSQNPEIATIDSDGIVTGLKPGKASIFAILDSGKALSGTIEVVSGETIIGDCNNDSKFDIADVVFLQKWLLTENNTLPNWIAADLNDDGYLNVVDLSIMKNMLLSDK